MGKEIKNIIVLKNVYPKIFEEVIFILKKNTKSENIEKTDLVHEAKKIVDDYIENNEIYKYRLEKSSNNVIENNRNSKINLILNISLILSFLLFIILLVRIF